MRIMRQKYQPMERIAKNNFFLKIKVSRTGILTALIFLFFTSPSADTFAQTWFNNSWNYRKSHVISQAAGAGTNYQIPITVNYGSGTDATGNVFCNSHCQTDFADVRFTASDGTTLLNYWRESFTASTSAVFWVQVQGDLTISAQTIYIYYGATGQATTSNGTNTFLFYSDWEDNTLQGWTINKSTGTGTGTVVSLDGSLQLRLNAPSTANRVQATKAYAAGPGIMIESKVKTGATAGDGVLIGFSDGTMQSVNEDAPVNSYSFNLSRNNNTVDQLQKTVASVGTQLASVNATIAANTYYNIGLSWAGTTLRGYRNRVQVLSATDNTFSTRPNVFVSADLNDKYYDWVFVRKYASPEPANSVWGVEALAPVTFSPASGCQGIGGIVITGTNFTGATAVNFNGVAAVFTVNSATQITATVPLSATTGIISVITPGGTATSVSSFTVNALPVSSVTNQTNITCFSANDGTITVSASGGAGPYTFSVDNGVSFLAPTGTNLRLFTGLVPNTAYRIKVKDNNGCISK